MAPEMHRIALKSPKKALAHPFGTQKRVANECAPERLSTAISPIKKQFRNARRRFGTANKKYSFRSLCPKCNDDRRQRRKQGGVVGARRTCRPRHDADAGCRNPIAAGIQNRFTCPPAAPPARLSGRADGSLLRQRSRPRAARTGRWRSPRPGGRADSAAPARWALRFPADGR